MSIEIESAEYVFCKTESDNANTLDSYANFEFILLYSVVRLIQQYLKESNLNKTLQTLQVSNGYKIVEMHLC